MKEEEDQAKLQFDREQAEKRGHQQHQQPQRQQRQQQQPQKPQTKLNNRDYLSSSENILNHGTNDHDQLNEDELESDEEEEEEEHVVCFTLFSRFFLISYLR